MHLDFCNAVALAGFAATAFHIETESSGFISSGTRLLCAREQFSYRGKNAGVGCRIRSRSAANRALVDVYALIDILHSRYRLKGRWG